jgi:hypothetical protein
MKKGKYNQLDKYILANRKGSREAELEKSNGFRSNDRAHKNFKKYSRKNSVNQFLIDEDENY